MAEPQIVPIPEIFVLWHPRCQLGGKLARRILEWFRPGNGLGPEVFYRSLPAPDAPVNGLPPPLPGEPRLQSDVLTKTRRKFSNLQIVLPLIDENMVVDHTWRHWLNDLALDSVAASRVMMPVALDASAYNMPPPLQMMNYLRPAGLPLPAGEAIGGRAYEGVVRSLLQKITEATCRVLLPRPAAPAPPPTTSLFDAVLRRLDPLDDQLPKVNIFISHAKVDGTVPAQRLRNYIYSQTQLAAFYDENDIAYGSVFSRIIQNKLYSSETAALIAVRSAAYAGRPWCRREISLFRQPRQQGPSSGGADRWFLYPTLVVEAMEGSKSSAGVPEFGNTTVIRWTDDDPGLEEMIVTAVIRDAMLAAFHAAQAAPISSTRPHIIINWLPDPTTLLRIPGLSTRGECEVFYPGRGISPLELRTLWELFPSLTFLSFEEALS